jgi:hypothetical protein
MGDGEGGPLQIPQEGGYKLLRVQPHNARGGGPPPFPGEEALQGLGEQIQRCCNPKDQSYARYGGRCITVCEEWKEFVPFRDCARENGYQPGLTIDRKDKNLGYFPSNRRWQTLLIQQRNTRRNRLVSALSETKGSRPI